MRAISIRPAELRRISTSLTVISNFAAGSYDVFTGAAAAETRRDPRIDAMGKPAVPITVALRNCRRPRICSFILASMADDRELRLSGETGLFRGPAITIPRDCGLDGPYEHPYTP